MSEHGNARKSRVQLATGLPDLACLATVRIHVEKLVEDFKKYILASLYPRQCRIFGYVRIGIDTKGIHKVEQKVLTRSHRKGTCSPMLCIMIVQIIKHTSPQSEQHRKRNPLSKQHMRFIRKEGMRKDNITICCHCTGRNKMDQNEGDRKRTKDERNMTGRQRAEGRPSLHQ